MAMHYKEFFSTQQQQLHMHLLSLHTFVWKWDFALNFMFPCCLADLFISAMGLTVFIESRAYSTVV